MKSIRKIFAAIAATTLLVSGFPAATPVGAAQKNENAATNVSLPFNYNSGDFMRNFKGTLAANGNVGTFAFDLTPMVKRAYAKGYINDNKEMDIHIRVSDDPSIDSGVTISSVVIDSEFGTLHTEVTNLTANGNSAVCTVNYDFFYTVLNPDYIDGVPEIAIEVDTPLDSATVNTSTVLITYWDMNREVIYNEFDPASSSEAINVYLGPDGKTIYIKLKPTGRKIVMKTDLTEDVHCTLANLILTTGIKTQDGVSLANDKFIKVYIL
ncbi:MAG: hypothetical protein J1F63_00960 [Oscillospiraceae bacterium]|nr:hypothetical protein [Oscillospiraceae bacterium]